MRNNNLRGNRPRRFVNEEQHLMIKRRKKLAKKYVWSLRIASVVLIGLLVYFCYSLLKLNVLPIFYLIPIVLILVCVVLLVTIFGTIKARRPISRLFSLILIIVLVIGLATGSFFINKTMNMFDSVTNLTDQMVNKISVVVSKESDIESLKDLEGKTIATANQVDNDSMQRSLADIEKNEVPVDAKDYPTLEQQVDALYNNEVDALIISDAYRGFVHDIERFTFFNSETKVVHETMYYTDRQSSVEESDDAVHLTREPFTIFISGNDSYGSLKEVSRSDVNMLVTINPSTHKVLMISIPRDYYLPVACDASMEGCPEGQKDKLTHTGLSGIVTSEMTLEKALDITINYNVRVNFSSLVNLVDALGGIDVEVEEGLEVEKFAANNREGVHAGTNHLDGERALAFARERYAYQDGDAQRVRNQQQVLMKMIEKITSPQIVFNFGKFMDALSGAFETNMSSEDMLSMLRYEFTFFPKWEFESYSLVGLEDMQFCPYLGDNAYVSNPFVQSIEIAKDKIDAINTGESSTSISDEITSEEILSDEDELNDLDDNSYGYNQSMDPTQENMQNNNMNGMNTQTNTNPTYDPYNQQVYQDPTVGNQ